MVISIRFRLIRIVARLTSDCSHFSLIYHESDFLSKHSGIKSPSGLKFADNTAMKKILSLFLLTVFLLTTATISAQSLHVGVFGGTSSYSGDLVEKYFPGHGQTKAAFGVTANYELFDQIFLRGGLTYARVGGADSLGEKPNLKLRNLSFQSSILEFSVLGEFYLMNLYNRRYSPYLFGGLALYHFDPYAYTVTGQKVFLQPLSTEGQGLPGYTNKPYKLTQLAIPFGGGIKYAINDNFRIGLEFGLRKLFTDHLDDLSTNFADQTDLLNAKGQLAVDMAYREDEVVGGNPSYPAKGAQRGSVEHKDFYYTLGLHLTYRIGGDNGGGLFSNFSGKRKYKSGCPPNPM